MKKIREFCDICKQEVGVNFKYGYLTGIDLPAVESFIPLDSTILDEKIVIKRFDLCKPCLRVIVAAIQKIEKDRFSEFTDVSLIKNCNHIESASNRFSNIAPEE